MQRNLVKGIALLLCAVLAVGCGGPGKKENADDANAKQVITDKGSDTMVLLAQKWSEEFGKKNPSVQIQVTGGGSGTGISALINGTTDIANASRPMTDDEKKQIRDKYGADVVEIAVAKDGIAIYANEGNTVEQLTMDQLRDIYTEKITDWKDVGGKPGRIVLYGRENSSGTYSYFKEHVLNKGDFPASTQTLTGTSALVNAVSKDANGIGYGGEAYLKGVKALKLVGADGTPVEASKDNVLSGKYPLSRSLFFYLRQQPSGAIKTYIDWVLSPEGQSAAAAAGYYPVK